MSTDQKEMKSQNNTELKTIENEADKTASSVGNTMKDISFQGDSKGLTESLNPGGASLKGSPLEKATLLKYAKNEEQFPVLACGALGCLQCYLPCLCWDIEHQIELEGSDAKFKVLRHKDNFWDLLVHVDIYENDNLYSKGELNCLKQCCWCCCDDYMHQKVGEQTISSHYTFDGLNKTRLEGDLYRKWQSIIFKKGIPQCFPLCQCGNNFVFTKYCCAQNLNENQKYICGGKCPLLCFNLCAMEGEKTDGAGDPMYKGSSVKGGGCCGPYIEYDPTNTVDENMAFIEFTKCMKFLYRTDKYKVKLDPRMELPERLALLAAATEYV